MTKIGFIAPTKQVYELGISVIHEMGLQDVVVARRGNLEVGLNVARTMEQDGFDVIVTRGGTAERIMKSEVCTPVVVIPVSSEELSHAMVEAKRITGLERPRIALLVYQNMRQEIDLFARLLGADLRVYNIHGSYESIAPSLARACKDGLDVVVGGMLTTQLAEEQNLKAVLLTSSAVSIRMALAEANKVCYAVKLEQTRAQRFKMLVENIRDGILYVDDGGLVQVCNPAAQRMLELCAAFLLNHHVEEILPLSALQECLEGKSEMAEEIVTVGSATLVVNIIPIRVGAETAGAIISLLETNRIFQMDAKIRKGISAKGLVATYRFDDIWGRSTAIREAKRAAAEFASMESTVFISGETGTGKELFAQSIHNASPCAQGPFVAINCAALPPSLLESELFGYEEGAFTGANRKGKPGLIELAHTGSLFLDEISEMDHYGQVRLLRFLQEKQIMRLGGDKYLPVQVRVIAASNKNLSALVRQGLFREDLYYRLKVLALILPPLRQRLGDVLYLVEKMRQRWEQNLERQVHFSPEALSRLAAYSWPGNVRELNNILECLIVTSRGRSIGAPMVRQILTDHIPQYEAPVNSLPVQTHSEPQTPLPLVSPESEERTRILHALQVSGGNYTLTAEKLAMHRSTLYRKIRRYGISLFPQ